MGWKRERLVRLLVDLRKVAPTPYPVIVQQRKLPGRSIHRVDGLTLRKGRRLYIVIDPRLTWAETVEVALHEWAHAATWRHDHLEQRRVAHDHEWALCYGKIYSLIHDRED